MGGGLNLTPVPTKKVSDVLVEETHCSSSSAEKHEGSSGNEEKWVVVVVVVGEGSYSVGSGPVPVVEPSVERREMEL